MSESVDGLIEFKQRRISFLEGLIEGIRLYAVWKDGKQLVGVLQKQLTLVIQPYQEEIQRLTDECSKLKPTIR